MTTSDEQHVERFARFLRIVSKPDDDGRVAVTNETLRYVLGEDVEPVAVDEKQPAVRRLRVPRRGLQPPPAQPAPADDRSAPAP
jgi:hypothetical protein